MLSQFQPFIDYGKMIENQAKGVSYRISKKENKAICKSQTNPKVKKLGSKRRGR